MAVLPIVQYPNVALSSRAEPVTEFNEELQQLAADMTETMYAAPGVGLAANQVGVLKRIVVIDGGLGETATAMEEMNATVMEVAKSADQTAEAAEQAKDDLKDQ